MKDTSEYTKIYKLGNKALYVHKGDCHYSFLLEEGNTYTEVIVSKLLCYPRRIHTDLHQRFRSHLRFSPLGS